MRGGETLARCCIDLDRARYEVKNGVQHLLSAKMNDAS
jgi:hypothetical protein